MHLQALQALQALQPAVGHAQAQAQAQAHATATVAANANATATAIGHNNNCHDNATTRTATASTLSNPPPRRPTTMRPSLSLPHTQTSKLPSPSPTLLIPSTSSSPLIPIPPSPAQQPLTRARSNSNASSSASSSASTSTSTSNRPSLLQRRASRSLSLSLPTSPLLMDPTDQPMLVSPSLYPPTLVANNLYLGSQHSLHYLRAGLGSIPSCPPDAIAVLNVAEELAPLSPRTAQANRATHYLHIPMSHAPNLADHLPTALAFIDTHLTAGRPVLVHCMCGVSRSAAVVLAYLMWKAKWGFRTAYEHVKARRNISPNMHLVCQLVEFAMDLELPGDHPAQGAASDASPDRSHQPTDSPAALLSTPPSVALAAEHQSLSTTSDTDNTDRMDVDHVQPPPLMDHVAQVMLVATTAAHARAASHPHGDPPASATSSPPDTPCSYMTAFTSLPTPHGLDETDSFSGLHPPAMPLTAASVDSPLLFASPARPIRRLSAATISTPTLVAVPAPSPPPSSSASSSTPRSSSARHHPPMSSICSITSSISTHTSLVSPQSAMLDAFPLTDPDLMAATRAGPMSASAKAAAQAQAAVAAAAAAVSGSPLGTPRTPSGVGMMTPLSASAAAAASRPRSRSNPNIPASYPLSGMHEGMAVGDDVDVPAVPIVPPAFHPAPTPTHLPVVPPPAPALTLSKPPLKLKRGTPPPRINTLNLPASGASAATSAPAVSHAPRLPALMVGHALDDVPPVPPLPPASAYLQPTTSLAATPPPLPPLLAIPPELDVPPAAPPLNVVEPLTPTTLAFASAAKRAPLPPLGSAPAGPPASRKPGGMRIHAALGNSAVAGLARLPPTPRVVEADECPTPSTVAFRGFFREEEEEEREEEERGYPWPSNEEEDRMDVCP